MADKEEFEARRFAIAVGVELLCIRSAAPIFIVVTEMKRIFFKVICTVSLPPEMRNDQGRIYWNRNDVRSIRDEGLDIDLIAELPW